MRNPAVRPLARSEHGNGPSSPAEAAGEQPPGTSAAGRVVVGVDDSPAGLSALSWAVDRARNGGTQLVAVRSWALGLPRHGGRMRRRSARACPHVVLYFDGMEQREASAKLVSKSFRIVTGGLPTDITVTVQTPEGDPGRVLTDAAAGDGDVLVLGREPGLSIRRLLHGSVSRYCRGHSRCPVIVVPAAPGRGREDGS